MQKLSSTSEPILLLLEGISYYLPRPVLEEKRIGRRVHFPDARSGWIDVALFGKVGSG